MVHSLLILLDSEQMQHIHNSESEASTLSLKSDSLYHFAAIWSPPILPMIQTPLLYFSDSFSQNLPIILSKIFLFFKGFIRP